MDRSILKHELLQPERLQRAWIQLRWQAARLGNAGKIGLGLLVVSGIFFLAAVLPQDATLQVLQERAKTMQGQLQSRTLDKSVAGKVISGDQALQIFYDFFPRVDSSPFWIRELVRVARIRGVKINSSEYRLVQEQGLRLTRYEMVLPVQGRYSQIRGFIADALQAVPAMAIVGVNIKRKNVKSGQLEVRLEINLYLDE